MCYKEERHRHLSIALSEKLKNVPDFITNFFVRYKSAATKNCNWGYIRDLLQWLIDKNYIKKHSISEITPNDLNKITPENIVEYFEDLQNGISRKKNSLDSINTKKNVFGAFWGYLFKRKYADDNIIQDDTLKSCFKSEDTQKVVKIPTEEQVESFLCNLTDGNNNEFNIIRNLAIVKLFIGSGIRSEELINLDMDDLYLDGGVKENNIYTEKPFINVLGKGKKEKYDSVYISKEAKSYLEDYLKYREMFISENDINNNALFLSNDKRRISKTSITSFFNRYSDGKITPHMLRHLHGTRLFEKSNNIVKVQRQLRHSSLETAVKYYVHIDDDDIANDIADL